MQNLILTTMQRRGARSVFGIVMGFSGAVALCQSAPPTEMPKDPVALLNLAAKSNGLDGTDIKPWRLKASFGIFDDKGDTSEQGTIEEAWASPHRSKITYTVGTDSETDYDTDKGMLRSVAGTPKLGQAMNIVTQLVQPITNEQTRSHWVLGIEKRDAGKAKVVCVVVKAFNTPSGNQPFFGPTYCLDENRPVLRVTVQGFSGNQVLFNDIRTFQDRYVAGEISEVRNGKRMLAVHLSSIEPIEAVDAAEFTPPADATPIERKIAISNAVAQGNLIKSVAPEYPIYAKEAGISGTVVLQAMIGKNGKITNLRAVSGPDILQQAAVDAVRQWVYRPYLLNGEPVSVDTTINVVFNLGHR